MVRSMPEALAPVSGCWVRRRGTKTPLGLVLDREKGEDDWRLKVSWGNGLPEWVRLRDVEAGLQPGWTVQDIPLSTTRAPMGTGRIVSRRALGGREQFLVQLDDD